MTFAELLKAQGLTDEQVKAITDGMKQNKIFTSSEENLDIRYGKLKGDFDALTTEHGESTKLIAELQKATKGNEEIQTKIGEYETQVTQLQSELEQTKKDSAVKVALLGAGVKQSDIDYLSFQMQKKGTEVKLDDDGNIKGVDDIIAGLKVQFPSQFETTSTKKVEEKKLDEPERNDGLTKAEFLKKSYAERNQFYQEHPDEFEKLMSE